MSDLPVVAFVAGATGYTGREVVRILAARGATVIAHVRPDSPRLAEWRQRFAALGARVDATPWEEAAMRATLAAVRPTHVFALLGTTRARAAAAARAGAPAADYEAVDYGLSVLLLRAAAAAPTRPRFIYLSSLGTNETTSNSYLRARARVEAEVRSSGLPYVIARPSLITGSDREESRPAERLSAVGVRLATAVLSVVGAGRLGARLRAHTGAELAQALVRLALAGGESRVVESEDL